jgi:hypothetical protein
MLKFGTEIRVLNSAIGFFFLLLLLKFHFIMLKILAITRSIYRFLGRLLYGSSSGGMTRFRLIDFRKVISDRVNLQFW